MRNPTRFACLALCAVVLLSCSGSSGRTLTSATGTIYECLVVMPNRALAAASLDSVAAAGAVRPNGSAYAVPVATTYDLVRHTLGADMPCLPQMEPYFQLTQVAPAAFDNFLKPTRNILVVDIDPAKYTQVRTHASLDVWARPQAVYRIQAPDDESFVSYWLQHGVEVREWFVRQELARQIRFLRAGTNKEARAALQAKQHVDMLIPEDYMLLMDTTLDDVQLLWCCNSKGSMRRDLVVYSYDYTSADMFSESSLNARRDAVLGRVVTAQVPGSYMATEYRYFPPEHRAVASLDKAYRGFYATEVRGLWRIANGEAMGGPYVSLTRLDQVNGRVVTAESFLFASGQKKRNALRQSEAVLYTLQLRQDTIH